MATTVIDDTVSDAPTRRPESVRAGHRRPDNKAGWALSAPFLVLYLIFLIGPGLYGLLMSFFNATTVSPGLGGFIGLDNYREVLTSEAFWSSMAHTLVFTIITVPPLVLLAFVLAVLTDRLSRGRWFFRLIFFAPFVLPVTTVTLIFGWLYTPQIGLFSNWLAKVGITAPNFVGTQGWAFASVAVLTVWWTIGFNFVLYLAGLQAIPRDLYEAAAIDGASPARSMRSITLPLLNRTTSLVTILQIFASLQIFNQIYLLTAGGPGTSTRPVMEYIYDIGFSDYRAGYGAAATIVYFVLVLVVSAIWTLGQRRMNKGQTA